MFYSNVGLLKGTMLSNQVLLPKIKQVALAPKISLIEAFISSFVLFKCISCEAFSIQSIMFQQCQKNYFCLNINTLFKSGVSDYNAFFRSVAQVFSLSLPFNNIKSNYLIIFTMVWLAVKYLYPYSLICSVQSLKINNGGLQNVESSQLIISQTLKNMFEYQLSKCNYSNSCIYVYSQFTAIPQT
ncbi:Hypothetical_protein [Hexamita inflata]|uniref:Hypothetical_protein n=1 Tax=Hexamita inflata TaxID=28002 RepID=A0AA86TAR2_9EUKA|nr:Hypothetical protein HINF_LOCUS571 [Hexamita inflata]